MKATSLILIAAIATLTACGSGGPATRVGRGIDNGVYHAGHGVKRAGQAIENAAR
ncbi:MAG TPA: hypothetical protein VGE39_16535 [Prosthecobacter sp.]